MEVVFTNPRQGSRGTACRDDIGRASIGWTGKQPTTLASAAPYSIAESALKGPDNKARGSAPGIGRGRCKPCKGGTAFPVTREMSRPFRASFPVLLILGLRSLRRLPQALMSGPVGAIACGYKTSPPIGDFRIAGLTEDTVTFRWKDRANGGIPRTATLPRVEFVRRYLQHVLPPSPAPTCI